MNINLTNEYRNLKIVLDALDGLRGFISTIPDQEISNPAVIGHDLYRTAQYCQEQQVTLADLITAHQEAVKDREAMQIVRKAAEYLKANPVEKKAPGMKWVSPLDTYPEFPIYVHWRSAYGKCPIYIDRIDRDSKTLIDQFGQVFSFETIQWLDYSAEESPAQAPGAKWVPAKGFAYSAYYVYFAKWVIDKESVWLSSGYFDTLGNFHPHDNPLDRHGNAEIFILDESNTPITPDNNPPSDAVEFITWIYDEDDLFLSESREWVIDHDDENKIIGSHADLYKYWLENKGKPKEPKPLPF